MRLSKASREGARQQRGKDRVRRSAGGKSVNVVLRPEPTGRYYISVGSDGEDRTGVYDIRVVAEPAE